MPEPRAAVVEIPPHLHCEECRRVVSAEDARQGFSSILVQGPQGFEPRVRPVPLCGPCFEAVRANERRAKLITPVGVTLPTKPGGAM
jgi:hypothetical protein